MDIIKTSFIDNKIPKICNRLQQIESVRTKQRKRE